MTNRRSRVHPRTVVALAALVILALPFPRPVAAAESVRIDGSPLALRTAHDGGPARIADRLERVVRGTPAEDDARGTLLAQRVITREWGASEDTNYVEVEVHGWRSEGWALALSGAVPGTGELYAGEGSGWFFLLAEAAGWTARVLLDHRADDKHGDGAKFAGSPENPGSAWSYARYAQATQGDTLSLQQLFAGDRDAFYHRVAYDDAFGAGWSSSGARDLYRGLEAGYQSARRRVRYATGAIVLVHVVSALDALHAAREHDLPLQRNLKLKLGGSIGADGEAMAVALERRF